MVELALVKIETSYQCPDGSGARVDGHHGAFDFRQLRNFPGIFGGLHHADDGAPAQFDIGRCLGTEA